MRGLIAEHGCVSVEDVAAVTGACRGCRTCQPDIEALLLSVNGPPRESP